MISRNSINGAFPIKRLGEVVEFLDSKRRPVTESDRRTDYQQGAPATDHGLYLVPKVIE